MIERASALGEWQFASTAWHAEWAGASSGGRLHTSAVIHEVWRARQRSLHLCPNSALSEGRKGDCQLAR
jgi:hypothetical protein